MREINEISHANVYAEDGSYLGSFEEVTLPEIKHLTREHLTTDMGGKIKIPSTTTEAMAITFKAKSYSQSFDRLAANPLRVVRLQIRANMRQSDGGGVFADVPVRVEVAGQFESTKQGALKAAEASGTEWVMNLNYYRLVIGSEEIIEIDAINMIEKVGGTDMLATVRQLLGI